MNKTNPRFKRVGTGKLKKAEHKRTCDIPSCRERIGKGSLYFSRVQAEFPPDRPRRPWPVTYCLKDARKLSLI